MLIFLRWINHTFLNLLANIIRSRIIQRCIHYPVCWNLSLLCNEVSVFYLLVMRVYCVNAAAQVLRHQRLSQFVLNNWQIDDPLINQINCLFHIIQINIRRFLGSNLIDITLVSFLFKMLSQAFIIEKFTKRSGNGVIL